MVSGLLPISKQRGLSESYNNLGVWYYQEGKLDEAVRYLEQGLAAGRESQMQNQIRRSAEFLSLCYQQRGELSQALEYKDLYIGIQDFIQRDKDEHTLVDAQNRYTLNRKQLQIEKLETDRAQRDKEIQAQKKVRNFLVAVVVLGAVVALLIFYLYVQKQRSNKRLQAANERVQQQNVQLQELNATKDKFFSIISHDLKGPLNSLTSFSGLLINHTDSLSKDEIKMLAKDLDKSLKNLFALLENLLEWSRSQTGNIEFNPESFDLTALLQQNKELLTAQAQNKNIGIQVNTSTPYYVNAHKHSVNTVIRNLLSNAIKFTPAGGTITLEAKENKGQLLVSVKDTGVGMPKEVLQKLFRIDTKHSTKGTADEKGTGLGLILCKEFIEKNGGTIWVESEVGKGSEFLFTLPYITVGVSGQRVTV
jgi:signal transduction histidine kinase